MKTRILVFLLAVAPLALLLPACTGKAGPAGPSPFPATPTPSLPPHTFLGAWRGAGTAPGQFSNPKGLWVDGAGDLFVADSYNNRIQEIPSAGNGTIVWGGTASGTLPGQFDRPIGVAVDPSGDLWVVDLLNSRLQELPAGSNAWTTIGAPGSAPGQFLNPEYLTFDNAGDLFVSDTDNDRIQELPAGEAATVGSNWVTFGSSGSSPGQFIYPGGVATDKLGDLFVVDYDNERIQELPAGMAGTVSANWLTFGSGGSGPGQFSQPVGIGIDPSGNLYVADMANYRIQELPAGLTGTVASNWVTFGSAGTGLGQFDLPNDVKTDSAGNVYVADSNNSRIQKFSP